MSVRFDAATDAYTSTVGLPTSTSWTVTAWVMLRTTNPLGPHKFFTLISADTGFLNFGTDFNGDGLEVYNGSGILGSGSIFTIDAWYRIAYVQNGSDGTAYKGADTGALTAFNNATFPGPAATNLTLYVGASHEGQWLNGRLAAFKMWNAALSQAEVTAELTQFDPIRAANLLRYHKFHVAEITDYSGNSNPLTAGSTATATEADPPIPDVVDSGYNPPTDIPPNILIDPASVGHPIVAVTSGGR